MLRPPHITFYPIILPVKARPSTRQTDLKLVRDRVFRSHQSQSCSEALSTREKALKSPFEILIRNRLRLLGVETKTVDRSKVQSGLRREGDPCFQRSKNASKSQSYSKRPTQPGLPSPGKPGSLLPSHWCGEHSTSQTQSSVGPHRAKLSICAAVQCNCHVTHETWQNLLRSSALGTFAQVLVMLTNSRGSFGDKNKNAHIQLVYPVPNQVCTHQFGCKSQAHRTETVSVGSVYQFIYGTDNGSSMYLLLLLRTNNFQNILAQHTWSKQSISGFTHNAKLRYTTVFNAHQQEKFLKTYAVFVPWDR